MCWVYNYIYEDNCKINFLTFNSEDAIENWGH